MTEIPHPPPPPAPLASEDDPNELSLNRIQQYVWARYVKYRRPPFAVDETRALAFYADHYRSRPMAGDSECFYYGILAYEYAFNAPEPDRDLLALAVKAFEAYRASTDQYFSWDVVDDRYDEATELLG